MLSKGVFSPTMNSRPHTARPTVVAAVVATLFVFFYLITFNSSHVTSPAIPRISLPSTERIDHAQAPRIAKVSMLYGGNRAPHHYIRSLRSHRVHNERFNYAMYTLQEDAIDGYWNKPTYLLSLIMQELAKPIAQRLEWIMWVDADLVLLNPSIPLETFLPPEDSSHINFLGSRDQSGLNTGTFFLRVHPWSIKFLTKALALSLIDPGSLGWHPDQEAMSRVIREPQFSSNGEVLFMPRQWFNAYQMENEFEGGSEANGYLLAHFPGLQEKRWKLMEQWLDRTERTQEIYDVPASKSVYAHEVHDFWALQTQTRGLLRQAAYLKVRPGASESHKLRVKKVEEDMQALANLVSGPDAANGPGTDLIKMLDERVKGLTESMLLAENGGDDDEETVEKEAKVELPQAAPTP